MEKLNVKIFAIIMIPIFLVLAISGAMISERFRADVCVFTKHKVCINIPIRPMAAPGSKFKN